MNNSKLYAHLCGVVPHQDLSAIREFEHNRKPIRPSKVMAVKEEVSIILGSHMSIAVTIELFSG